MKTLSISVSGLLALILAGCSDTDKASSEASSSSSVAKSETGNRADQSRPISVDDSILSDGLQATLKLAAERAVEELSKPGGFADNEALRIPLPDSFAPVESAMNKLGQEKLLDSFKDSLNEAARNSVAASPEILGSAISNMKMEDALSIWKGGKDAATRYLERQTRSQIAEKMLPIISRETSKAGATRYFQQISDLIPKKSGGLLGNLSSLAGIEIPSDFNLDQYVSDKALDGLYATLAAEESKIRANPAAHSTELIKSAFDYFSKK